MTESEVTLEPVRSGIKDVLVDLHQRTIEVILIRHAPKTQADEFGIEAAVTQEGVTLARELGEGLVELLSPDTYVKFASAPTERTNQTSLAIKAGYENAQGLAYGGRETTQPRSRIRGFGEFEGHPFLEVIKGAEHDSGFREGGGIQYWFGHPQEVAESEFISPGEMFNRVDGFIQRLRLASQNIKPDLHLGYVLSLNASVMGALIQTITRKTLTELGGKTRCLEPARISIGRDGDITLVFRGKRYPYPSQAP